MSWVPIAHSFTLGYFQRSRRVLFFFFLQRKWCLGECFFICRKSSETLIWARLCTASFQVSPLWTRMELLQYIILLEVSRRCVALLVGSPSSPHSSHHLSLSSRSSHHSPRWQGHWSLRWGAGWKEGEEGMEDESCLGVRSAIHLGDRMSCGDSLPIRLWGENLPEYNHWLTQYYELIPSSSVYWVRVGTRENEWTVF